MSKYNVKNWNSLGILALINKDGMDVASSSSSKITGENFLKDVDLI